MELYFSYFLILGIFVVLILLMGFYWNFKKKCAGFPFAYIFPSIIYDYAAGKISEDVPFNNVIFQKLLQAGKQNIKEGLFMIFSTRPVLFIFNEEAIKIFANEKTATDKSPEYKFVEGGIGSGILTSNGEKYKRHRKMINPVFHMGMLKEKVSLFNKHAMALVKDMDKLGGEPSADVTKALKYHYFGALSDSAFGLKQDNGNEGNILRVAEIVDRLAELTTQRIMSPWLYLSSLFELSSFGKEYKQLLKEGDDFVNSVIAEIKTQVCSSNTTDANQFSSHLRKSFAYILINQHLNDPSFTFEDVQSELKGFIIAGYNTVGWSTTWCLFLLGLHPDKQEKAFREVLSTTSDYITYDESCNLVYLNAVILETLRLYPTVPLFSRNLSEDVQFGKYTASKDTTVVFFPYLSQRDSKTYPDPEKFEPERFLNSSSKKSWNFIPFAQGSRGCIGKNYALIAMKIFLSHILRNFQIISLDRREDVDLCWSIVLTPVKPLRIKFMRRRTFS